MDGLKDGWMDGWCMDELHAKCKRAMAMDSSPGMMCLWVHR
jgi:hypothetical protein